MAYEMNNDSGSLFGNDRKQSQNQPDIKGQSKIVCPSCGEAHEYWVSGWNKHGQRGPWISLAFTAKDVEQSHNNAQGGQQSLLGGGRTNASAPQPASAQSHDVGQPTYNEPPMDFDDDIPF